MLLRKRLRLHRANCLRSSYKGFGRRVVDYPVNLPDIGLPDSPLLKSYAVLAQKLGSMVGQILDFNPTKMEVSYAVI